MKKTKIKRNARVSLPLFHLRTHFSFFFFNFPIAFRTNGNNMVRSSKDALKCPVRIYRSQGDLKVAIFQHPSFPFQVSDSRG